MNYSTPFGQIRGLFFWQDNYYTGPVQHCVGNIYKEQTSDTLTQSYTAFNQLDAPSNYTNNINKMSKNFNSIFLYTQNANFTDAIKIIDDKKMYSNAIEYFEKKIKLLII